MWECVTGSFRRCRLLTEDVCCDRNNDDDDDDSSFFLDSVFTLVGAPQFGKPRPPSSTTATIVVSSNTIVRVGGYK